MAWLKDPAWQQGLAIVLVVVGAILTYRGAAAAGELERSRPSRRRAVDLGVALPLISQAFRAHREDAAKSEDV